MTEIQSKPFDPEADAAEMVTEFAALVPELARRADALAVIDDAEPERRQLRDLVDRTTYCELVRDLLYLAKWVVLEGASDT